jgi:hypothetical protein
VDPNANVIDPYAIPVDPYANPYGQGEVVEVREGRHYHKEVIEKVSNPYGGPP